MFPRFVWGLMVWLGSCWDAVADSLMMPCRGSVAHSFSGTRLLDRHFGNAMTVDGHDKSVQMLQLDRDFGNAMTLPNVKAFPMMLQLDRDFGNAMTYGLMG